MDQKWVDAVLDGMKWYGVILVFISALLAVVVQSYSANSKSPSRTKAFVAGILELSKYLASGWVIGVVALCANVPFGWSLFFGGIFPAAFAVCIYLTEGGS